GYGKLDVPAALCGLGGVGGATFISVTPAADTLPQNAILRLQACAAGVSGSPITFTSSAPTIAAVDQSGAVTGIQPGSALIIAAAGAVADTARIVVVPPATVIASGRSTAPAGATRAPAGTLLSLLSLNLRVNGFEAVNIESLSFTLTGNDPGGKLIVAQDLNRNGTLEATDRLLGVTALGATSGANLLVLTPGFTISQRDSAALLVGLELSGAAPNNMTFALTFAANETRTTGARSGARDRLEPLTIVLSSTPAVTTVLNGAEVFSLSENPVRGSSVTFNFRDVPSTAVIYTLTGRRVRDLKPDISEAGRVIWELVNEEDTRVAPGVYLLVFDVSGRIVREKLFVLTPRN
ncbi:MAG TPA: Ig-like domain-containing protein, partial [Longimicrobiales bacterium]|nr:Ig-like domain-containing protein [Longimicrobiales bacterium]